MQQQWHSSAKSSCEGRHKGGTHQTLAGQKQKHFHPIFMPRVCFMVTGQLHYSFFLQQNFQSNHTTAACTAMLSQRNCGTMRTDGARADRMQPLLPFPCAAGTDAGEESSLSKVQRSSVLPATNLSTKNE